MTQTLSRDDARRIIVRAQLLTADRPGDVVEVAEQIGRIKIDPTAVIAPCEQTVLWSRIGWAFEPGQLTKAVERDRTLFELDGMFHPMSMLPLMMPEMRAWPQRESTRNWLAANERFRADVLDRLRAEGPLQATQIPDTAQVDRPETAWVGSNPMVMLECLARQGVVTVSGRIGRQRVWDLAERVFPADVPEIDPDEAQQRRAERRLQAAGIAKQGSGWTKVGDAGERVRVDGLAGFWRVDPETLAALDSEDEGGRVAFLNPYDGMLFDRPRLRDVFEFDYVLEQFKPKAQRRFGYFAHPILMGDRFVGQLDAELDKKRETLIVNAVHETLPFDPEEDEMVRLELQDLAAWLGVELAWR